MTSPGRVLLAGAVACGLVAATLARPLDQAVPATDRVAALNQSLALGYVPGAIARSHLVDRGGNVVPGEAVTTVDQSTIHTARWGGWYVTGKIFGPPYQPLGHRGNLTAMPHPTRGPAIVSDHVSIEWRNSEPETRGYLSGESDLAALLVFDHQVRAMTLLTRLNREARVPGADVSQGLLRDRVRELAD